MSTIEVSLPDRVESDIERLVEQGEFLNREQAIEEFLSLGISSYNQTETSTEDDEWGMQASSDQGDPALQDEFDDEGPMF